MVPNLWVKKLRLREFQLPAQVIGVAPAQRDLQWKATQGSQRVSTQMRDFLLKWALAGSFPRWQGSNFIPVTTSSSTVLMTRKVKILDHHPPAMSNTRPTEGASGTGHLSPLASGKLGRRAPQRPFWCRACAKPWPTEWVTGMQQ